MSKMCALFWPVVTKSIPVWTSCVFWSPSSGSCVSFTLSFSLTLATTYLWHLPVVYASLFSPAGKHLDLKKSSYKKVRPCLSWTLVTHTELAGPGFVLGGLSHQRISVSSVICALHLILVPSSPPAWTWNSKAFGERFFFFYAAPSVWNSLPQPLCHSDSSSSSFRSALRTHLFRKHL